jgi:plasmid stability protein
MDDQRSHQQRRFAEAVAPYGSTASATPHTKLSISLPADLVEIVRASAAATGLSVSATIGASLRRTLEDAEQASLDRAIEAQNQENLDWAQAYLPTAAKLWSELEW